jgi:hypothetical protein
MVIMPPPGVANRSTRQSLAVEGDTFHNKSSVGSTTFDDDKVDAIEAAVGLEEHWDMSPMHAWIGSVFTMLHDHARLRKVQVLSFAC